MLPVVIANSNLILFLRSFINLSESTLQALVCDIWNSKGICFPLHGISLLKDRELLIFENLGPFY